MRASREAGTQCDFFLSSVVVPVTSQAAAGGRLPIARVQKDWDPVEAPAGTIGDRHRPDSPARGKANAGQIRGGTRRAILGEVQLAPRWGCCHDRPDSDRVSETATYFPSQQNVPVLLPPEIVRRCGLEVIRQDDRVLRIRTAGPVDPDLIADLTFLTGLTLEIEESSCAPDSEGEGDPSTEPRSESRNPIESPRHLRILTEPVAAVGTAQRVDSLLKHAAAVGASDIHIEPYEHRIRVRMRLDGVLHVVGEIPLPQRDAVTARIKVMSSLDVAEKRRPQDGRFHFAHYDRTIDVRVATLPTGHGEKVVLRLLDRAQVTLDLPAVGLEGAGLETFSRAISSPHGMIVVTGPTGSGKTTTLYAALAALNREELNILTIEDPVEYDLPGINQTRVRPDIGFSFAEALRSFLRQDPDVIMVGEIRDRETADVAVRAALTGHLVLSTLHTNDAPSAVTRLTDMGVPPFLVAASLRLVVAQRLVRRVCPTCSEEDEIPSVDRTALGTDAPSTYRRTVGCPACADTGYRGRIALFELMVVDEDLAARIVAGADSAAVRSVATGAGMRTLRHNGCGAIRAGLTTPSEVLRATI
jgi:type II secretory ATPase GspE/PulE/Tfp pilus assembly ATPase PilB-like protein